MEGRSDTDKMVCRRPSTSTISRGLFNDLLKDLGPAKRKSDIVKAEIRGGPQNDPEVKVQLKNRDSIGSSLANCKSLSTSLHSFGSKLNLGRITKQTLVSEGSTHTGGRIASSLFTNRLSSTSYSFAQLEGSASSRSSWQSSLGSEGLNNDEKIIEHPVRKTSEAPDADDDRMRPIADCAQLDVSLSAIEYVIDGDVCTQPIGQTNNMQRKGSSEKLDRSIHSLDSTSLKVNERSTRRSVSRGARRRTRNHGECTETSDFSASSTLRRDALSSDRSIRSSSRRQEDPSSSLGLRDSKSPRASRSLSRKRGDPINKNSNHKSSSRRRRDGMPISDCSTGSLGRKQSDSIPLSSDHSSSLVPREDVMSASVRSTGSLSRKQADSISRSSDHLTLRRRRLALSTATTTSGSRARLGHDENSTMGGCLRTTSSRSSQSINSLMISRHQKKCSSATRERPLLLRSSSDDSRLPLLKMSMSTAGQRPSLEKCSSNTSLKAQWLQRSSEDSGQRPLLQKTSSHSSQRLLVQMSISTACQQKPSLERSLSNTNLKPPSLRRSSSHLSQRSLLQRSSSHLSQRSLLQKSSTHSKRSLLQRSSSTSNQRPPMQKSSSNASIKPLLDLLEQGSKQHADPIDSTDNESWCTEASLDISIKSQSGGVIFQSLPDLQSLLASDDSTNNVREGGTIEENFNVLANDSWDYGVLERNVNGCKYRRGAATTPPLLVLTDRQKHIMTSLIELEKGISVEYKQNPNIV